MASADPFPNAARQSVADQIAGLLPITPARLVAPAALEDDGGPELTESFAVCVLHAGQVKKPPADLRELVRPSGVWHHQIRHSGTATHFARSIQPGFDPDEQGVQQLTESPVAAQIDRVIRWIDRRAPGRATARLLVAPAYYLHAFAIIRDDKLTAVLADQPKDFHRIEYEREYPFKDFLKLLAKEKLAGSLG